MAELTWGQLVAIVLGAVFVLIVVILIGTAVSPGFNQAIASLGEVLNPA